MNQDLLALPVSVRQGGCSTAAQTTGPSSPPPDRRLSPPEALVLPPATGLGDQVPGESDRDGWAPFPHPPLRRRRLQCAWGTGNICSLMALTVLESLAREIRQRKETRVIQTENEEVQLCLFADDYDLVYRKPKGIYKNLLKLIHEFSKVAGYKISQKKKSIVFL